jgi:hypothetical protein
MFVSGKIYTEMKKFIYWLVLLHFCISTEVHAQSFVLTKYRNILKFEGAITSDAYIEIKNNLDSGIRVLLIDSNGGDGIAGLAIAKEIRKRDIIVVVNRYCFSSCANYIFIGAKRKSLSPGAILGFHGGLAGGEVPKFLSQDFPLNSESELLEMRRQIRLVYRAETIFFSNIGFNPAIFEKSFDLTRPDASKRYIEIIDNKQTYRFDFSELELAKKTIDKMTQEKKDFSYTTVSDPESKNKAYFPSLKTLLKYGASGIINYSYPKNKGEVKEYQDLFDSLGYFVKLNLVCDF